LLLLLSQVTELVHIILIISKEAIHMVAVLRDTSLTERGNVLEVNSIELLVEWVLASPIAESGLVTVKDVLLDSSDVVAY